MIVAMSLSRGNWGREKEEHSKLSYRQLSNRSFVNFGLLCKKLVAIGGMSGAASHCEHWILDALHQFKNGRDFNQIIMTNQTLINQIT